MPKEEIGLKGYMKGFWCELFVSQGHILRALKVTDIFIDYIFLSLQHNNWGQNEFNDL